MAPKVVRYPTMANAAEKLIRSGYEARREQRLEEAKCLFADAVELCRGAANKSVLAGALTGLGQIERDLKNNAEALQLYLEAASIYRSLPDRLKFAHTIRHVADILRNQGAFNEARPCYEEALAIYREHDETPALDYANALRGFALLVTNAGERVRAQSLWQEAKSLYSAANVQAGVEESDAQIQRLGGK